MKQYEAIIATSRVDLHGESMTVESLRSLAESINQAYMPFGVEHDPREPPIGRMESAYVRQSADGEHEVVGVFQLFGNQVPELGASSRELKLRTIPSDRPEISYDRNNDNAVDMAIVRALADATGSKLSYEVKKALEPISVLCIAAGTFAIGAIAHGFFSKLGDDGYEALKVKVKELFARHREGEKERLLEFEFAVQKNAHLFHVEVIATNPSSKDIDDLLYKHLERLDASVIKAFDERLGLKKLVYEVRDGDVVLKFGVRRDGVPIGPARRLP